MSKTFEMTLDGVTKRLATLEAMYCSLQSTIAGHEMDKRRVQAKADDVEEEMRRFRVALVAMTKAKQHTRNGDSQGGKA